MAEETVDNTLTQPDILSPEVLSPTQMASEIDPPTKAKVQTKPLSYEDAFSKIQSKTAASLPSYDPDILDTKFVDYNSNKKYLNQDYGYMDGVDNDDFYAQNQHWYTEIPKAVPKLAGLVVTKLGTGVGFTLGLLDPSSWMSEDGVISAASDNAIASTFAGLEDKLKNEWMPTYQEAADRNKGFFSRAFSDLNFWTEDVVDGAAFMASAFIPGMALSKLGAGTKFAQLLSTMKIGANAADAVVDGAAMAQNYLGNAQKIAKGFDAVTTWATATASEAMFEAKDTRDKVLLSLDGKINDKTGVEYTETEKKEIAGGAARNTFLMNTALLGLTNAIQMKYMYKALGMTAPEANPIIQSGLGSAFSIELPTSRLGKFLASTPGKFAEGLAVGTISEGYVEENTQLAIQRMNEKYGAKGKIMNYSNYGEVLMQAGKQIVDATQGNDTEAATSIGLGALLGGIMGGVGDVRESKRERFTTESAVQALNTTQSNWLKFGDIYKTEEIVTKDAKGQDVVNTKTVVDDQNRPVEDPVKLAAVIAGLRTNLDQMKDAETATNPNEVQYLRDSAFRDFVQAHIDAGIEDTLDNKLQDASLASPEALAAMGFDPNSQTIGDVSSLKSFAKALIAQNTLIKNSVLQTGSPEQEQARMATLTGLAAHQTIINRTIDNITKQAETIKSNLVGFNVSSGSDTNVDQANEIEYQIKSQESALEQLKNGALVSNFEVKAAEDNLKELKAKKAKLLRDYSLSFEDLTPGSDGLYKYENAQRNQDALNRAYQLALMQRAAYTNSARTAGLKFAQIADTVNGLKNFLSYVQNDIVDPLNAEMDSEDGAEEGSTGAVRTITITDSDGNPLEQEITEGAEYVTAANEENKLFRGKVVKTYNNNLIKVIGFSGDNITIRVNNDKTYTITPDRFSDAGRLYPLASMSLDERLYFKNRDIAFNISVSNKYGSLHSIKGTNAEKDFSRSGKVVKARLVLQKENGTNVLKIQYVNPVTKKTETVPYSRAYLAKYGDQKFNLRTLPGEAEELDRISGERTTNNLNAQLEVFNNRITDATKRLQDVQAAQELNKANYEQLRDQLINDRTELELVTEELDKYAKKRGRRTTVHNNLIKLKGELATRITDAQNQIDQAKIEKANLETLITELQSAKDMYQEIVLDLEITETPFDRQGRKTLSGVDQEAYDQLNKDQVTRRLSNERVDDLILDTQNELQGINDRINNLTGYIKDLKTTLRRIDTIADFMDFQDLPASVATRKDFRGYLADKIARELDPAKKAQFQDLYRQVSKGSSLKGDISFNDMMFLVSSLRDSIAELSSAEQALTEAEDKLERLLEAQAQKTTLSTLQERIDYLNDVQSILTEDINAARPVVETPVAVDTKPKNQEALQSDVLISNDPYSETFGGERLPKFEEVGFNKSFGRQYSDDQDQEPITENGAERFFQFTSSQNVANQGLELMAIDSSKDNFGITQTDINPNDIKLVLVKRTENSQTEPEAISFRRLYQFGELGGNPTDRSTAAQPENIENDKIIADFLASLQEGDIITTANGEKVTYRNGIIYKSDGNRWGPSDVPATGLLNGKNDTVTITRSSGSGSVSPDIAADYLLTGGFDTLISSDYLLLALSGVFSDAQASINNIRNKYAKNIADENLQSIKDFIKSDLYKQVIEEIRNTIRNTYSNPEVENIFNDVIKYPTGMTNRLGNDIESRLSKLNIIITTNSNIQYIGVDGQVLENPSKDNLVYTSMSDINKWTPERVRQSYSVASTTTDEQIQAVIDEHKAYQQSIIDSETPVFVKAVNTSPGIQRVETLSSLGEDGLPQIAKAPVEGRVIEDTPDWTDLKSANNPEVNIELRVSTASGAIAPGILPGRAVMQEFTYENGTKLYGDKITRVFNRPLEDTEKETIIQALVRMTQLFGRKDAADVDLRLSEAEQNELDLIYNYLKGIIPWGTPQTESSENRKENSNRFFSIQNGLNRGELKVPFTEAGILTNREALLEGVFHHINNRALKNNDSFDTIKIEDGRVVPDISYETYQEYLLSDKDGSIPPVYTSLPRADSGTPQRTQSFINWVDPNTESIRIEVEREVETKPQLTSTERIPVPVGIFEQVESFLDYKSKGVILNGITIFYIPKDGGVAIQFKKGDLVKTSSVFKDAQEIKNKRKDIIEGIKQATGYQHGSKAGLRALGAQATVIQPSPSTPSKVDTETEKLPAVPTPAPATGKLSGIRNLGISSQAAVVPVDAPLTTLNETATAVLEQNKNLSVGTAVKLNDNTDSKIYYIAPLTGIEAPGFIQITPRKGDYSYTLEVNPNAIILDSQEIVQPVQTVPTDGPHFTIEEAVESAKPLKGFLSASLSDTNIQTGELRIISEATVKIPDGNLLVARKLLRKALMDNLPDEEAPFREVTSEEVEQLEDFKALETFMSENLPQIPVNKVSELIAGKAWGQFNKGAIYIYENAEIGTGFHEAFEAVWASFLTPTDQERIAKEFRARKGQFTNPFTRETKDFTDASDYDVREMLAEEFREHVLNEGNNLSPKSAITKFFKQLWNAIKSLVGLNKTTKAELEGNINRLFKKIGSQGFKRSSPVRERSEVSPAYRLIPGLSQDESNSAVEGLTYYFFSDMFREGKSIDTILNELTPEQSKVFVNNLFESSFNKVLNNANVIGKRVTDIITASKATLFSELKSSLERYGLQFDEDVLNKEETATNTLGIRDSITVNPQKMTAINVKLLIAALPDTTYSRQGQPKVIKNSLNQPKLVDYNKTHNMLLNELSNIVPYFDADGNRIEALDLMFAKLDDKHQTPKGYYKAGYAWIKTLKMRLRYEDESGMRVPTSALTDDDIRLRVSFIKSFTNNRNLPEKTIIGPDGYLYNLNPVNNVNTDRVKQEWMNNIKNNFSDKKFNTIERLNTGQLIINRNGSDYKFLMDTLNNKNKIDLDRALEALERIGIVFTSGKQQLNKYEGTIRENTIQILTLLQSGVINSVSDLYGTSKVNGRIDTFLSLESRFTAEDNILSYLNSDGQSQYSVGIPSLFGQMINIINSVGSLKSLIQTAPWLGNIDANGEVKLFGYSANSELLRKGGPLFNNRGTRREGADIRYHIISGLGTSDYEGKSTDVLQFPERVANEIHYLMQNIVYSNINSDKSTEFGLGIPGKPLASVSNVSRLLYQNSSPTVTDIYINQLTDELFTALDNTKNPSMVEFYRNQVESLGHFRDVMGKDFVDKFKAEVLNANTKIYTSDTAHLDFVRANRADIESKVTAYIKEQTEKTVEFLLDLDLFEKVGTMYITDAIDNESLREFIGVPTTQTVKFKIEDDTVERQGFTEANVRSLAGFLAVNKELLLTEQHKLIYGHPTLYKDLPKRANGATSTKEQMVEDREILNWMDEKMTRNDGKVRGDEKDQTLKVISFADSNVLSESLTKIAEGIYDDMTGEKSAVEEEIGARFDEKGNLTSFILDKNGRHTGSITPYAELNEADGAAWGMPDIIRDMLYLTGKLTKGQSAQFDYEIAYEKVRFSERGLQKYSKQELAHAEAVLAEGNPGYIFQVLKPQYFGYVEDSAMMHTTFLKNSVQPKFFRHVEGTQFEELYIAAKKDQIDVVSFQSGQKVGNVENPEGGFTPIYDGSGAVNVNRNNKKGVTLPSIAQQKLYSKFWGIQVEMSSKAKFTVVRGTQITKLIMVNSHENGVPISPEMGTMIEEYNSTLVEMMKNSKKDLIKELGLRKTADGYETSDVSELVKTLRDEAVKRDLPDNMIAGIATVVQPNGDKVLKYHFDTLNNSQKLDNILNSIVDSRVISEKIHGKASVQVASTLYEANPRNFVYMVDGVYTPLTKKDLTTLTEEQRKSIRMTSSDLKFYTNENGKTTKMEAYISWPFKDINPEDMGLVLENGIYKPQGNQYIDERLLVSLGFRIPTQAMNSIESISIKGFTPANNGDMIVVPSEIVGKSGSDFDIDKLNLYLGNYYQDTKTKRLNYVEYKNNIEDTRKFYEEMFDRGELMSEKDLLKVQEFIEGQQKQLFNPDLEQSLETVSPNNYNKTIYGVMNAALQNLFSDEALTQEFLQEMSTDTGKKNKIVDAMVKKSLQNHLMETMHAIIQHSSNYRQLVTPNSVDTIKGLATEITALKIAAGTKTKQDEKSYNYLRTFIGSSEIRERYLTAKRMVGIAALHSTFHSLAQVAGTKLTGDFKLKSLKYLAAPLEERRTISIKLKNNSEQEDGTYNIGSRLDAAGNLISETGSEKLSGFVDGAKDPFVFDLNLNMNTASTWFYLDHHGVPQRDIAYFFNQPILDQYFKALSKNNSGFKKINDKQQFPEGVFYDVINPYYKKMTGKDLVQSLKDFAKFFTPTQKIKKDLKAFLVENNNKYKQFSPAELKTAIEAGYSADPGLQLAVLYNYLELSIQGRFLSNYIQAIGYDNSKTKSIQENQMQVAKWNRSIGDKFIANPDSVLDKTFIGQMKVQKEDVFDMFKSFFITLSPKVQKVFAPIEELIADPEFFSSKNDMAMLLQRYQSFILSYILHTTTYSKNEKETSINSNYGMLFGENSMAKTLGKIKQSADPSIADNMIVRDLLPLMTDDDTKTDNISLFRNKLDTYNINQLTESIEELREYAADTADTELLNFIDNLTTFSLIQSGIQASNINFSTVLPTSIYSEQIKNIISNFIESGPELDVEDVWYNFHANQWQNKSVTPSAPSWVKFKGGKLLIPATSPASVNDYITKTVKRAGLTSKQVTALIKEKRFNEAFDTLLLRKSDAPNVDGKFVYTPVNKKGDGPRFTEISSSETPSMMTKNGDVSSIAVSTDTGSGGYSKPSAALLNSIMGAGYVPETSFASDDMSLDPSEFLEDYSQKDGTTIGTTPTTEINDVLNDKDQGCKK